jgi:molybdate transport system substrate-binding protein
VTRPETLDQAEREGLVQAGGRTGPWRNRLVVAAARQPAGPDGSFAAPDPSPGSDIDGPAILQRLGIPPASAIGAIDTDAVAWLLTNGAARQGLLHQSDVSADDRLRATAPVPDSVWPPILYAATVTRLARRPDPGAFVAFLGSVEGKAALTFAGLEVVT